MDHIKKTQGKTPEKTEFIGDGMKYFISEQQRKQIGGSCYFEFQKGQKTEIYNDVYWKEDSLLLHMDIVDNLELFKIIPNFNYYGITIIDRDKWNMIQRIAENENGIISEVIAELKSWADKNFETFDYFVICGI